MDETKLVFFTGAPGSKWSAVAHVIAQSRKYKFDTGDYAPDRQYCHNADPDLITHNGSYFGPGFPFGSSFDKLERLPKQEIFDEINSAWITQNGGYKIIKCHQFSIDLPLIYKRFPNSKYIITYRKDDACIEGWFGAGGFDITYPQYKEAYTNRETMIEAIKKENRHNLMFIHRNKLTLNVCNEGYFNNFWDVDTENILNKKYVRMLEGLPMYKKTEEADDDVTIGRFVNKQKLDTFVATLGF